jgi:hypothetical protein
MKNTILQHVTPCSLVEVYQDVTLYRQVKIIKICVIW